MNFTIEQESKAHVLRIQEERLDNRFTSELKAQLLLLVNDETSRIILVDLAPVIYTDSSGLGALLLGLRQARDHQKKFALIHAQKRVLSLIKIAHLNDIMVNYDSVADAVKHLS